MATATEAVREASRLVSQAIATLAALGVDAPVSVRCALQELGAGYAALGMTDPGTPYGINPEDKGE